MTGGRKRIGQRDAGRLGNVDEGDAGSLLGERRDDGRTDAAGAAGDEHRAAVQARVAGERPVEMLVSTSRWPELPPLMDQCAGIGCDASRRLPDAAVPGRVPRPATTRRSIARERSRHVRARCRCRALCPRGRSRARRGHLLVGRASRRCTGSTSCATSSIAHSPGRDSQEEWSFDDTISRAGRTCRAARPDRDAAPRVRLLRSRRPARCDACTSPSRKGPATASTTASATHAAASGAARWISPARPHRRAVPL